MRFLGMFQLNVCAEYLIEYFPGFLLRLLFIGFGLFDTDDLTALGTFAEEMTGAIHFVPGAKPTHVGQFWFLHAPSFPLAEPFSYPCGNHTDPLPNLHGGCRERRTTYRRNISPLNQPSCCKIAVSNNVGHVKHYMRTPLRALVEERHFALVGGLRFPTWARF